MNSAAPISNTSESNQQNTGTSETNISLNPSPSNDASVGVIGESQQLLSSFRNTMERRINERAQSWRSNFSNVLQDISPLVQHAQSVNNSINAWMPNTNAPLANYRYNPNNQLIQPSVSTPALAGDSYVINLDGHNIQATGFAHIHPGRHSTPMENSRHNIGSHESNTIDEATLENYRRTERNLMLNEANQHQRNSNQNNSIHNHHHHMNTSNSNGTGNNSNNNPENNADEGPMAEALAQIPEARALFVALFRYTPYICIILAKTCYDHVDGILDFVALFITFSHANWVVRQEIAKHAQRSMIKLLRELLYIVLVIVIIGFMLETKSIYISLMFANNFTHPFTLRNLLFSVGVTDLILKLITVGVKIIITLLPRRLIEYKGRGRIFLMTEAISQLYRGLAPIQPWLVYLLDAYTGSEKLLGVAFSAVYMVAKGSDLVQTALFVKRAFIELLKKVSFGTKPSKEQLQGTGGQCPICHDTYTSPVQLECTHIFCELCVGTWFDREQTCPLCRAKVVDDPSFRDGATTQFVQLF